MYTLHLCIVTGRKHSKSATSVEHLLRKPFSLCPTAFSHMFFSSTYLIFYVYIGKKLGSLQRNQIFTSSLQDFSNSALWKNTPPKLNMRALHQYAHTSCAHIGNLCLLGKIFNLSKSFHPSSVLYWYQKGSQTTLWRKQPLVKDCKPPHKFTRRPAQPEPGQIIPGGLPPLILREPTITNSTAVLADLLLAAQGWASHQLLTAKEKLKRLTPNTSSFFLICRTFLTVLSWCKHFTWDITIFSPLSFPHCHK